MDYLVRLLGQPGIVIIIGLMVFIPVFRKADKLFTWIEDQTFGTRNFIIEKLNLLFIDIKEENITYGLIGLSFGGGSIIIILIGLLTSQWLVAIGLGIVFFFTAFKIPKPLINQMIKKRHQLYASQMVDALTLLSNGIRAGLSVPQALGMVVDEMPGPVAQEFGLMLQQNKIGVPLEECFESLAKRVPLEDNDMFVSGVNILRETGGNLAETFDTIVDVIRERVRLKQKVEQFVAQGMFQGIVIAGMPFGIGAIYFFTDPDSMIRLFTHPLGIAMCIVAFLFDAVGFFVILKIVDIKT
ncbi:MAG: type II secretion system F family protein [Bacteriovoracaceae bacterium]